jgi:o-succinylbenzoate synthase
MKITRVRWAPYRIPFRTPYVTSRGASTHRAGLMLELATESGATGWGEAAPDPALGITGASLAEKLAGFAEHLLGADLEEVAVSVAPDEGAFDPAEPAIACAIDVATLGALASAAGVSVAALLKPSPLGSVPVNALITTADASVAQTEAAIAHRSGFGAVKLKVAVLHSLDAERERVAAVREAIGADVKLRLDPNGAWTEAQAVAALRAFERFDIEYVEQPIAPGDIAALARIQAAVEVAVAADEDVLDLAAAERLIAADAVQVLVLKPQRLGGLRPAVEIAQTAEATGLRCVVTTSIEAGIGAAACLQLAAAVGGGQAHGLATLDMLGDTLILKPGLPIEDGRIRLPDAPGLGVALDEAALMRYSDGWREVSA